MFGLTKLSKTQRLIILMKRQEGASNYELNAIMFRYGAQIHLLRKDGHKIETVRVKNGLFRYYMEY